MPRSSSPQKGHHHTQSDQTGKRKTSKNQDEIDGKKNKVELLSVLLFCIAMNFLDFRT